jgi:hypothetical protein
MLQRPAPLSLAHEIAPLLVGLRWAIGGSVLLHRLGLEAAPRDLDVVTTPGDFEAVRTRLGSRLQQLNIAPHPRYASRQFARLASSTGIQIDLMADIAVHTQAGVQTWAFDAATIEQHDGLPWMRAADWLQLYNLFDRPQRVAQLAQYLRTA